MLKGNTTPRPGTKAIGATVVFLKLRDIVIRGDFCELVRGEFPMTDYEALPLQLPAQGTTSNMVQLLGGPSVTENGGFSDILYLPLYSAEKVSDTRAVEDFSMSRAPSRPEEKAVLAKTPLLVIATRGCTCMDEERHIQAVHVLPIWGDGTSVLLDLDWCEGDPCEDCISPEWHLRASTGLPLEQGLAQFADRTKMFPGWKNCKYHMYIIPSLLGAKILPDNGEQWPSPLWRHQWTFATCDELRAAASRFTDQMAQFSICT